MSAAPPPAELARAFFLGLLTDLEDVLRAHGDARATAEREWVCRLIEARRCNILRNRDDPTRTEHFAALQVEIRRGPPP